MAPASDAARDLQNGARRPAPIVPAVPLPFVQKRKQRETAAPSAGGGDITEPKPAVEHGPMPERSTGTPLVVNGTTPKQHDPKNTDRMSLHSRHDSTTEAAQHANAAEQQEADEGSRLRGSGASAEVRLQQPHGPAPAPVPVPPQHPSAPSSATSSNFSQPSARYGHPGGHQPQLSNGSMVFGGHAGSSNPSPGPGPNAPAIPQYPPHPPTYMSQGFAPPFYPPAHSQHGSDSQIPFVAPQASHPNYPQRTDVFVPFRHEHGFASSHGRPLSFAPPEGYSPFSPGTPVGGEGRPPPPPNNTAYGPPSVTKPPRPGSNPRPLMNGSQPAFVPAARVPTMPQWQDDRRHSNATNAPNELSGQYADDLTELRDLRNYLVARFFDPSTADAIVELRHQDSAFAPVRLPSHRLLLGRSPALQGRVSVDSAARSQALVETSDKYVTPDAFQMALRNLYGEQLLSLQNLHQNIPTSSREAPTRHSGKDFSDFALAYAAAGHLLKMPRIVERGTQLSSRFLSWESVETILAFAMEGTVDERSSVSAGDDLRSTQRPKYGQCAEHLLQDALSFIIDQFPLNFTPHISIPQMALHPHLPPANGSRTSKHNPRLSLIQFGELPSEDSNPAVLSHQILSKILLSVPFALLKDILESPHLGTAHGYFDPSARYGIVRALVEERERRRQDILRSRAAPTAERESHPTEWSVVGWEESVSDFDAARPDHIALSRVWKGF